MVLLSGFRHTDQASHHASYSRGDLEQVGDCLGIQQFILIFQLLVLHVHGSYLERSTHGDLSLDDDHGSILSSDGNSGYTGT